MLRAFDASSSLSISWSSSALRISSTYLMNFLQSNHIDIDSLMPQEVFENSEIHNDAIKIMMWFALSSISHYSNKSTCFMMYSLFNSRYQYSHRCFISWRCIFRTSQFFRCSIARFTIRFYVIFEINKLSNFDSFVFAIFASMHDLILKSITLKKFVRKFQTTYRWENHIVEKTSKFVALKKFARKFQIEFVKIQSKKHKRLLWKNVENTIFANVLDRCCNQNSLI